MAITRSERLYLREFVASDAPSMEPVFLDPEVMRYGIGAQEASFVAGWIERRRADYQKLGHGLWALVRAADDQVLGYCGLTLFPDIDGSPEIEVGYRLARRHWGNGFATEGAMAVRDHAFESLGVNRLIAIIDPANTASIGVAVKLGMAYEKDVTFADYDHPDRIYSMSRPGSVAG